MLKYELIYKNIGVIKKIKEVIIPEESEKEEAPPYDWNVMDE